MKTKREKQLAPSLRMTDFKAVATTKLVVGLTQLLDRYMYMLQGVECW